MGHRALVAYERDDGRYDLHYSHWGAADLALQVGITDETPFGRPDGEPGRLVAVDPEPRATGLSLDAILEDHLDFRDHEAFYVVTPSYEVTAYRTLWFGLCYETQTIDRCETAGNGALVAVYSCDPADDGYVRGWFRGTKTVVADLVDRGAFSEREAHDYLEDALDDWAEEEREVIPVRERA